MNTNFLDTPEKALEAEDQVGKNPGCNSLNSLDLKSVFKNNWQSGVCGQVSWNNTWVSHE